MQTLMNLYLKASIVDMDMGKSVIWMGREKAVKMVFGKIIRKKQYEMTDKMLLAEDLEHVLCLS